MATTTRVSLHHGLLFLSGLCGLGFQVVWTRWFGFSLGHEMSGVMGVVGAFFLGLALGAWAFDQRIARSERPGMWYVGLEVVIGVWALVSVVLLPQVDEFAASWLGPSPAPLLHAAVATLLPALLLFPATVAMGATLPAMERFVARSQAEDAPRLIGGLYAANTAGAMCGTLLITFLILPALGFQMTTTTLAVLNFVCAGGALALGARAAAAALPHAATEAPPVDAEGRSPSWALALFATGGLGIAFETIGIRMLTQILENTIYTFSVVLSVYLGGTAIGAAAYQRWLRDQPSNKTAGMLLSTLSLCCLAGLGTLEFARPIHGALGDERGFAAAILTEGLLAALLFLAPTIVMGATFAALAQAYQERARSSGGGGLGRALSINTFGSALAPSISGWLLIPAIGLRWAAVAVALGYAALAYRVVGAPTTGRMLATLGLLGWLATSDLSLIGLDEGERVLQRKDGTMATVTVTERRGGTRVLRVDNHFRMGGTQSAFSERRQGLLPLLLHPAPKRALFLGLGSGATLSAATLFEDLTAEGVELVPEVIDALPMFESVNLGVTEAPNVRLVAADARRFVRGSAPEYDVIVADLFQPARDGAGALYTEEHFTAVKNALAEGGLFAQWLPLYQMDEVTAKTIAATFQSVFPETHAFLASFNAETPALALVGGHGELRVDFQAIEARMKHPSLSSGLVELALADPMDLLGCRLAGPDELSSWYSSRSQMRNTDDRPVVMFEAPQFIYRERQPGWTTLERMIERIQPPSTASMLIDGQKGEAQRVDDYVTARNAFLLGQIALADGRGSEAIDHYVASVAPSKDFTVGYTQVTSIANVPTGVPRAKLLEAVEEIARLRPDLGDLRALKRQLAP